MEQNEITQEENLNSRTPRRTFSVSKEFENILVEIDNMPNMSRFVCEAIKEKLERTKNPNKEIADALNNFIQIQSLIANPNNPLQSFSNKEESTPSKKVASHSAFPNNEPKVEEVEDMPPLSSSVLEEKTEIVNETKNTEIEKEPISSSEKTFVNENNDKTNQINADDSHHVSLSEIEKAKKRAMKNYF